MRKHIKIRAELVKMLEGDIRVKVTFMEQSHFGGDFGNRPYNDKLNLALGVFHPGRVRLISRDACDVSHIGNFYKGDTIRVWVPEDPDHLGAFFYMNLDVYKLFKETVEEYNSTEF